MAEWALALAAAAVVLFYLDYVFPPLPLYAADEGAYLIHALYGKQLAADPTLAPDVQRLNNTAFLLLIRALTYVTRDLLEWMRILGAAAYVGGLFLVWRAVRRASDRPLATGFLLLALAFPYYRFVVTAMPEGWYVGLLGVLVLATARLYVTRPATHALVAGALTGILVLLKPHGLAVVAAFAALAVGDAICGRRDPRILAMRLGLFVLAFLAAGALAQLAAGQPIDQPFSFFIGGHYGDALDSPTTVTSVIVAMKSLVLGTCGMLLLAGIPIATGLARIAGRWRWSGRAFRLDPAELTFLLILLSTAATLVMVAIFSMKALAAFGPTESNRLWGRYFEFFAPMLWLAAAPFIDEFERGGGRTWRMAMALLTLVGLAGLSAFLWTEVMLFPWDSTALTGFFLANPQTFNLPPSLPYFPIATVACMAAAMAMGLSTWRARRIWLVFFVVLGVLSTLADADWRRSIAKERSELDAELHVAETFVARRQGEVAVITANPNASRIAFWRLRARARLVMIAPGADIGAEQLSDYDTIVLIGAHNVTDGGWRPVFQGGQLWVLRRAPPESPTTSPAPSLGSAAGTG